MTMMTRRRRRIISRLGLQFLVLHLTYESPQQNTYFVDALVTLESGQRLIPRYFNKNNDHRSDFESNENDDSLLSNYNSFWDLPRIEQWATQRQLSQHHLKSIYRVITSYRSRTSMTKATCLDHPSSTELNDQICGDIDTHELSILQQKMQDSGVPKMNAAELVQQFRLRTIKLHDIQYPSSLSGGSIKLVFQLPQTSSNIGRFIETVIIRHENSNSKDGNTIKSISGTRYTVCVSSQVGCTRACTFCATGTQMKFLSQLTSSEIVEQVYMAQQVLNHIHCDNGDNDTQKEHRGQELLRNIVFMGMGEPLDNWEAVYEACRILTHQCILQFNPKRITISTVGVTPNKIRQMARDAPSIRLAISLHGATQSIREQLMPATKSEHASLQELESALDDHIKISGQYGGPMIEYLLIDDVNDTEEEAKALIEFCQRRQRQQREVATAFYKTADIPTPTTYVNLIPYNPTLVGTSIYQYRTPADEKIVKFHGQLLQSSNNIKSHIRWSSAASRDTSGACGQLALLSSKAGAKKL